MNWALIVLIGAAINVANNYGYKLATAGVVWVAGSVMAVSAVVLVLAALALRRPGWAALQQPRMASAIVAMGFITAIIFACFIAALQTGPISLIDPLWACIYSLASLLLGMVLMREKPGLIALAGIGLYIAGAALMGLTQYDGGGQEQKTWLLLVLFGAVLNGVNNYIGKICTRTVDIPVLVGTVYGLAAVLLLAYGFYQDPATAPALLEGKTPYIVAAMGLCTPVFAFLFFVALKRGPLSLVDPLWACIYGLGSVAVGMAVAGEKPAMLALAGVGLYLVGAFCMARDQSGRSQS